MKQCTLCKRELSDDEFYKLRDGRLKSWCKQCCKQRATKWKRKNAAKHRKQNRDAWANMSKEERYCRGKRQMDRNNAKLNRVKSDYLDTHPCSCGETRHPCLDFHHLYPSEKEREVSKCRTVKTFLAEAIKCTVVCSNCHRMIHAS